MIIPKVKRDEKAKLLMQIAKDIETATGQAHAAARSAVNEAKVGRPEGCLQAILEVEPKLYDAKKLFGLATYINDIGQYERK